MRKTKLLGRLLGGFLTAALFLGLGGTLRAQDTYNLVTDASTLYPGNEVLIVGVGGYAMSDSSNEYAEIVTVAVTIADNAITNPDVATAANEKKACVFTVEKNAAGNYAFKDNLNGQYLLMSGSDMIFSATASYATITINADGAADVLIGSRYVRFYSDDAIFKGYTKNTTQGNIYLYKKHVEGEVAPPSISTDETELSYKINLGESLNETLAFKAANLVENVTVAVASADEGRNNAVIGVDKTTINVDDASAFNLVLSTSAELGEGTYSDTITVTSGDAKVKVTVTLVVKKPDVYQLVRNAANLKDGDVVLIVGRDGDDYYVMDAETMYGTNAGRPAVKVQVTGNTIIGTDMATKSQEEKPCEISLVKNSAGNYAFIDAVAQLYLSAMNDRLNSQSTTSSFIIESVDVETGAAKIKGGTYTSTYMRYNVGEYGPVFQMLAANAGNDVYFYKKQDPNASICGEVTLNGVAVPTENSVTLTWNALETAPDNGYRVTVTDKGEYNVSKTVTDGTQIVWDNDLIADSSYIFSIISLCGDDFESEPVTGVFRTLPEPELIITPATLEMNTVQGTPATDKVTVKGINISSDVTVTCPDGNFSVSPATLTKEDVMSENGAELTVTFNGEKKADTVELLLTSGELTDTITVTAMLKPNLIVDETLSMNTVEGTSVSEKVVVKGTTLEDDVTVACPEGNFSVSPATLTKEDVMSENGAEFTVTFNGEKEADTIEITLTCGDITKTVTVTATAEKPELTVVETLSMTTVEGTSVSEKVTVKGTALENDVTVACPEGNFSVSPATLTKEDVMSENGAEFTVTFNGEKEADTIEITLTCGDITKTITVTATATATPIVNECEAPTQLNATVAEQNVTLSWNGEAEKYRVKVMLGEKEVCNELVEAKSYELKNLEAGEYAWSVASVCENGEEVANGENFTIEEPLANDAFAELACRIYPNPTTGVFYVELAENANMEIFTLGGVMVRNEMLKAGRNEVRLDRSGIYFVRLTNAHGAVVTRVIVK